MPIETLCPGCGRKLRVGDEHAGKQARCPVCSTIYTVGATASAEPSTAEPSSAPASPTSGFEPAPGPAITPQSPDWYMRTPEGQTYGPTNRTELDRWVSEGRVSHDCQLRNGTSGPWQAADLVYASLAPNRSGGAYVRSASAASNPYSESPPAQPAFVPSGTSFSSRSSYAKPHRGTIVLVLGIMSWITGCFIFGVVAWVMGSSDVREMKLGRMDDSGLGLTQAGYILGMVHAILGLLGFMFFIVIMLFAAVAGN